MTSQKLTQTDPQRCITSREANVGLCRKIHAEASSGADQLLLCLRSHSIRFLETIREEELGEDNPLTHVLFLPQDENFPSAPFPCVGKSDKSDVEGIVRQATEEAEQEGTGASSSSVAPKSAEPSVKTWRSRRSVSRIRYGQQIVNVVRLSDPKGGFGRRESPAVGTYQLMKQSRKG